MASSVTDQVASAAIQGPETEQHWTVKHRSALLVSSASLLIVVLLAMMSNFRSPSPKTALTRQNHGVLVSDRIRVSGSTEAVRMRTIVAPMLQGQQFGTLTITKLVTSGTHVGKGDLLVDFDRQAQMRNFVDKQDEYQKLANQVIQEQAKDDAARAKDETEIQQAESNLSKAQLEMQKRELLSRIDAEKAQQTLEEAKATLQQLRATFDLKRKSAHSAVRLLEIQRDRAQEVMEHARSNTELMQIKSPIDGVVVLNTIWKQGKMGQVQEGDQVRAGVSFMQVVDPSSMQVRAFVNQEDFLALQFGLPTGQRHSCREESTKRNRGWALPVEQGLLGTQPPPVCDCRRRATVHAGTGHGQLMLHTQRRCDPCPLMRNTAGCAAVRQRCG